MILLIPLSHTTVAGVVSAAEMKLVSLASLIVTDIALKDPFVARAHHHSGSSALALLTTVGATLMLGFGIFTLSDVHIRRSLVDQ
jgi:hypothetical protein